MFTRCPACRTLFRLQPKQLKAARGQVRCGSCQAVFDGLEFLVNREELNREELAALVKIEAAARQWQLPFDDVTPQPVAEDAAADVAVDEPALNEPAADERVQPSEVESSSRAEMVTGESAVQAAESAPEPEVEIPPAAAEPPPAPPRRPRYALAGQVSASAPSSTASRLGWSFGSLLLIAVLAGQITWFNRDALALDPRWRPWLQMVCDNAGCILPPLRDPAAIEMVDRNVQSHPQYQGALYITATLVNQAPFAQPYPQVELSMTDLDQKRVAWRRFLPSEYLDNGNARGLIAPGASVRLKLEIADPGQEAVGFEFEFF